MILRSIVNKRGIYSGVEYNIKSIYAVKDTLPLYFSDKHPKNFSCVVLFNNQSFPSNYFINLDGSEVDINLSFNATKNVFSNDVEVSLGDYAKCISSKSTKLKKGAIYEIIDGYIPDKYGNMQKMTNAPTIGSVYSITYKLKNFEKTLYSAKNFEVIPKRSANLKALLGHEISVPEDFEGKTQLEIFNNFEKYQYLLNKISIAKKEINDKGALNISPKDYVLLKEKDICEKDFEILSTFSIIDYITNI